MPQFRLHAHPTLEVTAFKFLATGGFEGRDFSAAFSVVAMMSVWWIEILSMGREAINFKKRPVCLLKTKPSHDQGPRQFVISELVGI